MFLVNNASADRRLGFVCSLGLLSSCRFYPSHCTHVLSASVRNFLSRSTVLYVVYITIPSTCTLLIWMMLLERERRLYTVSALEVDVRHGLRYKWDVGRLLRVGSEQRYSAVICATCMTHIGLVSIHQLRRDNWLTCRRHSFLPLLLMRLAGSSPTSSFSSSNTRYPPYVRYRSNMET